MYISCTYKHIMYVCLYVCMCIHVYTHRHIYIYACTSANICTYVCTCAGRDIHANCTYTCTGTPTLYPCACACVCVRVYVYVYMYVCTRSYVGRAFAQIWSPPPSKSTMVWCHSGVADRESNVSIKCEHPTIMVLVIEGVNTPVDGGVLQRLSSDVSWPARRRVHVSLRLSKKLLRKSGGCHTKRVPA